MGPLQADSARAAAILNAAYYVRYYRRPVQRAQRAQAIKLLGLTVRQAFNETENFEPLLIAVVDGLRPRPELEPF
jgi:hypothetical protein